jgi:ER degradation enhancer, mannosidase alpha-like 2
MKNLFPLLLLILFTACQSDADKKSTSSVDKAAMADSVKMAFQHAWNGYKQYAWGHDALTPLSRNYRDWYAESLLMTPVDAFDSMKMLGMEEEAKEVKQLIFQKLSFDKNISVQVFEVTIRLMGGLLAAYQIDGDEQFLFRATDLANRLLPAFDTPTGIPYRYIHLQTGEKRDSLNNPAEAGTLMLEFGTISKLTGSPIYYDKAKKAMMAVYERHSAIGLPGTVINAETGEWLDTESHISGRIDSYYEYMLKAWLLFGDEDFKKMWDTSIVALNTHLADSTGTGFWYAHADMNTGEKTGTYFGALDAFMPALLALGGDLDRAKALQESCFKMWNLAGIEPEMLDYSTMKITNPTYALRPENIESAFYLHQFTKDDRYLEMGKTMFDSIVKHCKNEAGFAAIRDVTTMEQADDMESFFFAETLKYAWLLFTADSWDFKNTVFNTEAHPIRRTW